MQRLHRPLHHRAGVHVRRRLHLSDRQRWEVHQSVHQVHGLRYLPPGPGVPNQIQLQLPMLQQQPVQRRQRRYRGNACPGFSQLAGERLVVLELNIDAAEESSFPVLVFFSFSQQEPTSFSSCQLLKRNSDLNNKDD
uniref:Uncharacterized protein n=1 Tax=Tetraodon nigroviridis TaxID=99883 RepID=H3C478_TETNG